jgi:hypothetical protein
MTRSTHPTPNVRQLPMFGIVAVLASTAIAILIATDAVNPYPTLKAAYLICAVIGCVGLIQVAYSIGVAKRS